MKNTLKRLLSLALCALLVFSLGAAAAAQSLPTPTLVYDYNSGFDFENATTSGTYNGGTDSWASTTDLFAGTGATNIFPGDTLEGQFAFELTGRSGYTYDLYFHAKTVDEDSAKVLEYMEITVNGVREPEASGGGLLSWLYRLFFGGGVQQVDGAGENVQYADSDTVTNRISLGSFQDGDTATFDLQLHLDETAGNDLQDKLAKVVWVFTIEETAPPTPPPVPTITPDPVPLDPELNREDHFGYIIGRGEGGVQPMAEITRAEVATIFFRMLTDESRAEYWAQENPFTDVASGAWYNNAVSTLYNAGVVNGYDDGSFKPNNAITRAEFAVIATRFYDEAGTYEQDAFNDISGHWARDYINRAAELGLVNGYEDGSFRPNDYITRAEAMQLMNNVLGRTPDKNAFLPDMLTWVDNMNTDMWYYAAVQEATNSHEYEIDPDTGLERWTEILPVRDWDALEEEWSTAYSGLED